jgi:hypothetical protein
VDSVHVVRIVTQIPSRDLLNEEQTDSSGISGK